MLMYAVGLMSHAGQTQVFSLEIQGLLYLHILSCNVAVV
jgi:hypothetical protein